MDFGVLRHLHRRATSQNSATSVRSGLRVCGVLDNDHPNIRKAPHGSAALNPNFVIPQKAVRNRKARKLTFSAPEPRAYGLHAKEKKHQAVIVVHIISTKDDDMFEAAGQADPKSRQEPPTSVGFTSLVFHLPLSDPLKLGSSRRTI